MSKGLTAGGEGGERTEGIRGARGAHPRARAVDVRLLQAVLGLVGSGEAKPDARNVQGEVSCAGGVMGE